jgi:hypothetical protein
VSTEDAPLEPVSAEPVPLAGHRVALVVGVAVLAVIAVVGALYLARAFFVPLLIGILGSYALGPVVDLLKSWRIPRAAGAALVLAALVGAIAWATLSLEEDAASIVAKLPDAARKVRQHVGEARASRPERAGQDLRNGDRAPGRADAAAAGGKKPTRQTPAAIRPPETSPWVRDFMLAQSALLFTVVAQAPIVLPAHLFPARFGRALPPQARAARRAIAFRARRTPCASSRRSTSRSSAASSPSSRRMSSWAWARGSCSS